MKYILFYLMAIVFILASCKNTENIKIIGATSGYVDSTMLVLEDIENQIVLDTAYIINNSFNFEISISEPSPFAILTGMGSQSDFDYTFFWVENSRVLITAQKGELKDAKIEGSKIQVQADNLKASKKPIENRLDSLHTEFRNTDRADSAKYEALLLLQTEILNDLKSVDSIFIDENQNSLYSAYLLTFLMNKVPKTSSKMLYENLTNEIKESKYGEMVNKFIALSKEFKVGDKASNFQLPDLNGNMIGLDSFENKYILLEFWASGCGPCRMENPNLLSNYKNYNKQGFEIISISVDKNKDDWERAVKNDSMIWASCGDLKGMAGDVALTYSVNYIPHNFLIDPDGVIIAEDLRGEELGEKLKKIFTE